MRTSEHITAFAEQVATAAHLGQTDRAGKPYISHPARVAANVKSTEPEVIAAAWLHDVIEDTSVTAADLLAAGFSARTVDAVVALTHLEGESLEDYLGRVRQLPDAVLVKHADLADNTDPSRMDSLDETTRTRLIAKYKLSYQLLDAPDTGL